eukprot:5265209-Amphidinium_carterae.1
MCQPERYSIAHGDDTIDAGHARDSGVEGPALEEQWELERKRLEATEVVLSLSGKERVTPFKYEAASFSMQNQYESGDLTLRIDLCHQ